MSKIIKIDGGLGRVITATGSIPDECIVATSFPDIFIGNPKVKRVYNLGHAFLFEDVVYDNEWVEVEPYNTHDYYNKKNHLSQVFNKMWNGVDEATKPQIFLQDFEIENAGNFVKQFDKFVVFQPFGSNMKQDITRRAMPLHIAQMSVDYLNKKGYKVLYIKGQDHPDLKNVIAITQPIRGVFSIIANADKIITCDSFVQHAAAALDKKALVFWCGTDERNVGYDTNTNIRIGESLVHANRIPMNNPELITKNKYDWKFKEVQSHINKYLGMSEDSKPTKEVDKDEQTTKD